MRRGMISSRCIILSVVAILPSLVLGWSPLLRPSLSSVRRSSSWSSSSSSGLGATVESTNEGTRRLEEGDDNLDPEYRVALTSLHTSLYDALPEMLRGKMYPLVSHFASEYMAACQTSFREAPERFGELSSPEVAAQRFLNGVLFALRWGTGSQKFQFQSLHRFCRGRDPEKEAGNTVDLYKFGSDFFRSCMDLDNSVLMGMDNVEKFMNQLKQGHNVVMFANHQSEADPQVVACLFEDKTPYEQEIAEMIFVAGHKVTTDPLAVPFSMGRNLICIHSKKHIDADPETKPRKQKQNLKAMGAMLTRFTQGGALIWIAPSGGRDRRDVETGEVPLAPFDSKTIDMFRLMGNKSKVPTHFYTMAMVSYDLCPPPDHVEAGVGEARNVRFVPVGLAIGDECLSLGGLESRIDFCDLAFQQCERDYRALLQVLS